MSVTLAVVAKKVAVALLTDKRTWQLIGGIVAGIALLILAPIFVLMSIVGGGNTVSIDTDQIIAGLPSQVQSQIVQVDIALAAIKEEITSRELDVDPIKAQVIYIYTLAGKKQSNESFYKDYVSLLIDSKDDKALFDTIEIQFGIEIPESVRTNILEYYSSLLSQEGSESP
jgi:ABC-type Na+ efflux pump permease subunit